MKLINPHLHGEYKTFTSVLLLTRGSKQNCLNTIQRKTVNLVI